MNFYGIDIQVDEGCGDILIEGMRFNIGGLKFLRRMAERGDVIKVSLMDNGSVLVTKEFEKA
jgi:hypothetical protein